MKNKTLPIKEFVMETRPYGNITTRELFFSTFTLVCIVIVCMLAYKTVTGKHSIRITATQFNQTETSCSKNDGLHSVIFFRTATSLGATIRCEDGASFEHNFIGADSPAVVKHWK
jgi:hypothetical protein